MPRLVVRGSPAHAMGMIGAHDCCAEIPTAAAQAKQGTQELAPGFASSCAATDKSCAEPLVLETQRFLPMPQLGRHDPGFALGFYTMLLACCQVASKALSAVLHREVNNYVAPMLAYAATWWSAAYLQRVFPGIAHAEGCRCFTALVFGAVAASHSGRTVALTMIALTIAAPRWCLL